jgi:hypothetical protein
MADRSMSLSTDSCFTRHGRPNFPVDRFRRSLARVHTESADGAVRQRHRNRRGGHTAPALSQTQAAPFQIRAAHHLPYGETRLSGTFAGPLSHKADHGQLDGPIPLGIQFVEFVLFGGGGRKRRLSKNVGQAIAGPIDIWFSKVMGIDIERMTYDLMHLKLLGEESEASRRSRYYSCPNLHFEFLIHGFFDIGDRHSIHQVVGRGFGPAGRNFGENGSLVKSWTCPLPFQAGEGRVRLYTKLPYTPKFRPAGPKPRPTAWCIECQSPIIHGFLIQSLDHLPPEVTFDSGGRPWQRKASKTVPTSPPRPTHGQHEAIKNSTVLCSVSLVRATTQPGRIHFVPSPIRVVFDHRAQPTRFC